MSQLIQETKYITVQDFLPKWTKFAETHHKLMNFHQTQNQFGLEISHSDSCLVAEGHGFTDFYHVECGHCSKFSVGLLNIFGINYANATSNLQNFYKFKEGLYKHFMRFHKEKLLIKEVD